MKVLFPWVDPLILALTAVALRCHRAYRYSHPHGHAAAHSYRCPVGYLYSYPCAYRHTATDGYARTHSHGYAEAIIGATLRHIGFPGYG